MAVLDKAGLERFWAGLKNAFVRTSRTINGKALTGNITLAKSDVGLGSVDNYATATQAQAEAGTASNAFMTPQRAQQARVFNTTVASVSTNPQTLARGLWQAEGTFATSAGWPANGFAHWTLMIMGPSDAASSYRTILAFSSYGAFWVKHQSWDTWGAWKQVY